MLFCIDLSLPLEKRPFFYSSKKKTSHEQTPDNYGLISQFFFLSFNFFFFLTCLKTTCMRSFLFSGPTKVIFKMVDILPLWQSLKLLCLWSLKSQKLPLHLNSIYLLNRSPYVVWRQPHEEQSQVQRTSGSSGKMVGSRSQKPQVGKTSLC